jgi:Cof subfamily protein (haloacid dehalogenase superfamily)
MITTVPTTKDTRKRGDIRAVVCDIDDTLIRRDGAFPSCVIPAVRRLTDAGIPFTFASGRLPATITPYQELLGVAHPVVACNGALLWQHGKAIKRHRMFLSPLHRLVDAALCHGFTVLYAVNAREYCLCDNPYTLERRAANPAYPPLRPLSNVEWLALAADKLNIIVTDRATQTITPLEYLTAPLATRYAITRYGLFGFEIVAAGVSKAAGVREVAARLRIPLDRVMAIGDSENDNQLLREAGLGVAVANAAPETKACADYVCAGESGDGVVEAIERFCV